MAKKKVSAKKAAKIQKKVWYGIEQDFLIISGGCAIVILILAFYLIK